MQFKILNLIVATNCYLKKVKIKDNDLCDFCKIEKEDVYHLFYECNVVRKFWREFECYWNIKTGHPFKLSLKEIILGKTDLQGDLLNYCILVAKQYILTSKSNYASPSFNLFRNVLVNKYNLEKILFRNKGKQTDFFNKWRFQP